MTQRCVTVYRLSFDGEQGKHEKKRGGKKKEKMGLCSSISKH